jgi:uncharacterized protein YjbI with pentapeptide repeats
MKTSKRDDSNYGGVDFFRLWGFRDLARFPKNLEKGNEANQNIIDYDLIDCNLQEAKFDKMSLEGFDFSKSDLRGASFRGATLRNIKMHHAITGVSHNHLNRFKKIAYLISFFSGSISSYSIGFFIYLLLKPYVLERSGLGIEEAIALPYLLIFVASAVFSLKKGMRSYFPVFLLVATSVSFLHQIIDPSGARASVSNLSLSCFIGAFAGMLASSQSTYLIKEIIFLVGKPLATEKRISKRANQLAIFGSLISAIAGGNFQNLVNSSIAISSALLSILVVYGGQKLGVKAYEEKDDFRRDLGDTPFEYSIEEDLTSDWTRKHGDQAARNILRDKLVSVISKIEEGVKKSEKTRYLAVRLFFDSVLGALKTDFSGSKLIDTTFAGTNLNGSRFSPALVSLSPKRVAISNSEESYEVDVEDLKVVREAALNPGSTIIETIINIQQATFNREARIGTDVGVFEGNFQEPPSENLLNPNEVNMATGNSVNISSTTSVTNSKFGDSSTNEIGTVNVENIGSGVSSDVVLSLVESLFDHVRSFPSQQRIGAEIELKRLKEELEKPRKEQKSENINYYLKGLISAAAAVLLSVVGASEQIEVISANAVDVAGNAKVIAEEIQRIKGSPTDFKTLSSGDWKVVDTVSVFSDSVGQIAEAYKLSAE